MSPNTTIDQQSIRTRAHELWQERGCPVGSADEDWLRAEHELRAAMKVASDRAPTSSKARIPAPATRPKTLAR